MWHTDRKGAALKVLVIGSGGREHALCWKLAQSRAVTAVYAAPGNPGIAEVAVCVPNPDYLAAAEALEADLTIVGPEAPLADGIVDRFIAQGRAIVGPTACAAQLETSKIFAKAFMIRAGIPTARFTTAGDGPQALAALQEFEYPVVLKADGLAAGKGVVIARNPADAGQAASALLRVSPRIVIEEFLEGEEVSFIALADGERVVPFEPVQDHKAIFDGDLGPNTGGMGAYCDGRILTAAQQSQIMGTVLQRAVDQMRAEARPFTGFLFAGLMLTANGPKVLEFNARLGDPETQVLMHRMQCDLVPFLLAAAHGELGGRYFAWRPEPSVCVVAAAEGYPGPPRTGHPISGLEQVERATVFHAGTRLAEGVLTTAGGRVLGVTARGETLAAAIRNTYRDLERIRFEGMQYRGDIGQKGLKRWH